MFLLHSLLPWQRTLKIHSTPARLYSLLQPWRTSPGLNRCVCACVRARLSSHTILIAASYGCTTWSLLTMFVNGTLKRTSVPNKKKVLLGRYSPNRASAVSFLRFLKNRKLDTHSHSVVPPERIISSSQRPLPPQQTRCQRDSNPDTSNQAPAKLRLRQQRHRDRRAETYRQAKHNCTRRHSIICIPVETLLVQGNKPEGHGLDFWCGLWNFSLT
jgi:hypothetical protein